MIEQNEKIIQVSGFGVNNTNKTQTDYMIVGVTNTGRVIITDGYGRWHDMTPEQFSKEKGGNDGTSKTNG